MKIRKAAEKDFARIMEIYAFAREFMKANGNPNQWGATNWPPEDLIHEDIKKGNSYVCLNDSDFVIGCFYFVQGKDIEPTYKSITEGHWKGSDTYGVIHRLAGDGSEKGIGSFCIKWAYEKCRNLRIDTHTDNKVMQNLLEKLGFVHAGTIYVEEDDDPRLAYEMFENQK